MNNQTVNMKRQSINRVTSFVEKYPMVFTLEMGSRPFS
jgi:hypothetical protein